MIAPTPCPLPLLIPLFGIVGMHCTSYCWAIAEVPAQVIKCLQMCAFCITTLLLSARTCTGACQDKP